MIAVLGMVVQAIRAELEQLSDSEEKRKRLGWEKTASQLPKLYGIPTPVVRMLSSTFFQKVKKKSKQEILELCNNLLKSDYSEERTIAFDWGFRLRRHFEPSDFSWLEMWLTEHVHGWGACDDLCTHALGAFIYQFPAFIPKTQEWARSSDRWMRRASAVSLIYSVRRKERLQDIFKTADLLLTDQDVMVQKGYGWMLKEASNRYPKQVFDYVMKNRRKMPRTALRYAIEKLSPKLRKTAMKRE
jgi:3-methyladenine DNA glycosylase AlkD